MSFKISLKDGPFHISINSLGLQNSGWIFFLTCIFHHGWEQFSNVCVHIPRKCIESRHFYSCSPFSSVKTLPRLYQKMWRWLGILQCSYFLWFVIQIWWLYNFQNNIYHIVSYWFYCLLCNHDNLILKLHQKNTATLMGGIL